MSKPMHDNPAALRALLLQERSVSNKLREDLNKLGQQLLVLQQTGQRLDAQNRQLVGFLSAIVVEAGGEISVHLSTVTKLPETSGIRPTIRPEHDLAVLHYVENAPAEQQSLEAQAVAALATPAEPDPQTTCENAWHGDGGAFGVRCPNCGGKGKKMLVLQ